jgi:hypothetical protein
MAACIAPVRSGAYNEKTFTIGGAGRARRAGGSAADGHRGASRAEALAEILGALFAARGYGRLRGSRELEEAWEAAVGEPASRQTRLGGVRHGVLNVTVAHSTLLEELAAFRKPALLAALRRDAAGAVIHDIRFRVGPVDRPAEAAGPPGPGGPAARKSRPGPA